MHKLVLAAVTAAAVLIAAPAEAHPTYHSEGACYATGTNTSTSNGAPWTLSFTIAVVATDAALGTPVPVPIRVECVLWIDGVRSGVFAEGSSAVGVVADVSTRPVAAEESIVVCTNVFFPDNYVDVACDNLEMSDPDWYVCAHAFGGDDVVLGDKIVYDCPPYGG